MRVADSLLTISAVSLGCLLFGQKAALSNSARLAAAYCGASLASFSLFAAAAGAWRATATATRVSAPGAAEAASGLFLLPVTSHSFSTVVFLFVSGSHLAAFASACAVVAAKGRGRRGGVGSDSGVSAPLLLPSSSSPSSPPPPRRRQMHRNSLAKKPWRDVAVICSLILLAGTGLAALSMAASWSGVGGSGSIPALVATSSSHDLALSPSASSPPCSGGGGGEAPSSPSLGGRWLPPVLAAAGAPTLLLAGGAAAGVWAPALTPLVHALAGGAAVAGIAQGSALLAVAAHARDVGDAAAAAAAETRNRKRKCGSGGRGGQDGVAPSPSPVVPALHPPKPPTTAAASRADDAAAAVLGLLADAPRSATAFAALLALAANAVVSLASASYRDGGATREALAEAAEATKAAALVAKVKASAAAAAAGASLRQRRDSFFSPSGQVQYEGFNAIGSSSTCGYDAGSDRDDNDDEDFADDEGGDEDEPRTPRRATASNGGRQQLAGAPPPSSRDPWSTLPRRLGTPPVGSRFAKNAVKWSSGDADSV